MDAFSDPVAVRCRTYDIALSQASQDYVARLLAHLAMRQWEQEALAETQRDEAYDLDAQGFGTAIKDYRVQI